MKKILSLMIVMMVGSLYVWGQMPYSFSYQATVKDEKGRLVTNEHVGIAFSILEGSEEGKRIFYESQVARTNTHGVLSVTVGEHQSLQEVDWKDEDYFLKVEVDLEGGINYKMSSTQQLLSVPYALNVKVADSIAGFDYKERQVISMSHDTIFLTGGSFVVWEEYFNGDYNDLRNKPTIGMFVNDMGYLLQESQVIWKRGDTIFLTGGSYVVLPEYFDGNYNNLENRPEIYTRLSELINDAGYLTEEVQVLSISNDTMFLTGGSFVKLPKRIEIQDVGDVVALGNRAGMKQLKDVKDPTEAQDAVTLHYMDSIMRDWLYPDVDYGTHNISVVSECDKFDWHGQRYVASGIYTYAYANSEGHYSVDTLKLTIRHGSHSSDQVVSVYPYVWHGTTYDESGVYMYGYENNEGCPSIDTLYLTMYTGDTALCKSYREESDTAAITICGETVWYGWYVRTSGVYEHNLGRIAVGGCDSIVKVNINILPVFEHDTAVRTTSPIFAWRQHVYSESGDYGDTLVGSNGCDSIYSLHLMMGGNEGVGATKGVFSVSAGLKVRFAQGNLEYQSSSKKWRFAAHQYDIANALCISPYNSDWSDVYGWGTSGYHDTIDTLCVNYEPWAVGIQWVEKGTDAYQYNKFGYGPSRNMTDKNLSGTSKNYDWGVYNAIVNGGNGAGLWRTLSKEEWEYLWNRRPNARLLRSMGTITQVPTYAGDTLWGRHGYILLSDEWVCPAGLSFVPNSTNVYENQYSVTEWEAMEEAGAVFLPIKYRVYTNGSYWMQTSHNAGEAYALVVTEDSCKIGPYNRGMRSSVRLAQNVVSGSAVYKCSYYDTVVVTGTGYRCNGTVYNQAGDYVEVMRNSDGGDSIIYFTVVKTGTGELSGLFSVSASKKVKFSKGNLQYNAKFNVWRFAEKQYSYLSEGNKFISSRYRGWIDAFGWATSGFHDPTDVLNTQYMPWSSDGGGYGPSEHMSDMSIINTSVNYDWGVYNRVANGGNQVGQWRVLTEDEVEYLLYNRQNASSLQGSAVVCGVKGCVLLPDNWRTPIGVSFNASETNKYNETEWTRMEGAGAVFLPCSGYRNGTSMIEQNRIGKYWLSTRNEYNYNSYIMQVSGNCSIGSMWLRSGCSVRLVKDN